MASIQQIEDKWRAQVAVRGTRKSRVFDTKRDAEQWGLLTEARIRSSNSHGFLTSRGGVQIPNIPSAVLEAMAEVPYNATEIVSASYPFATSGIYFLIKAGQVVYVGQAIDLLRRINRHRQDGGKDFDAFTYIPAPPEELNGLEATYIKALMPRLNMSFGNRLN